MNNRKFNQQWAEKKKYGNLMPIFESSKHFNWRARNRFYIQCNDEVLKEISLRINNGLIAKCVKDDKEKGVYEYSIYTSGHLKELLNNQELNIIKVLVNKKNGTLITVYK